MNQVLEIVQRSPIWLFVSLSRFWSVTNDATPRIYLNFLSFVKERYSLLMWIFFFFFFDKEAFFSSRRIWSVANDDCFLFGTHGDY